MDVDQMQREGMALLTKSVDERPDRFPPVSLAETPRWTELIAKNHFANQGGPPLQPAEVFELADLNDRARVHAAVRDPK